MKNIAIPLLLAGSAKAEAKKKAAMLQDYAEPEPILIASSWTGDVCEDSAGDVAQALSDLQAAQGELAELEEGLEELEEAQDEAIEDRLEAIEAVIELDEEMEEAVEENNDDIADLIGLKEAWQAANVAASIGEALVASRLNAMNVAQDDYDEAVIDYAGFEPNEAEEDDGEEAIEGLLSVTEGLEGELDAAEETEAHASDAGSTAARNAAHIIDACTNCTSSADNGSPGDSDFACQCGGVFAGAEVTDFTTLTGYPNSLAELESTATADLGTKNTASDTLAAKNLLRIEYMQIDKYLTYATTQSGKDIQTSGTEADYDTSINFANYAGGETNLLTRTELIAEMSSGVADTSVTLTNETGSTSSALTNWAAQLRMVYGRVTGVSTANNTANDGDGSTTNSKEFDAQQTGSSGYADWVTDARTMVDNLQKYMDVYNASELASDGFEGAYTAVEGSSAGGPWDGACTDAAGNGAAFTLSQGADGLGGYQAAETYTLAWSTQATQAAINDCGSTTNCTEANTLCASMCSSKLNWGALTATNMPFKYTTSTNVLTSSDADATSQSIATMTNAYCLGFQVNITDANNPVCTQYFDSIPTGNTAESSGASATDKCFSRKQSTLAETYSNSVVSTVTDTGDWDAFQLAMTNWATAYETLIDKRADLDIAAFYDTELRLQLGVDSSGAAALVANSDASYGFNGYKQKYSETTTAPGTPTGALAEYNTADGTYSSASSDYTTSSGNYSARAVEIATANSDYLLAQAQWEENNALISKLTILTEIAEAASDAAFTAEGDAETALEDATDDHADAVIEYDGVAATEETSAVDGLAELQEAAEEAYNNAEAAVYGEEGTNTALGEYEDGGSGDLGTLFGLRTDALEAYEDLQEAMLDLGNLNGEIDGAKEDVEDALALHLTAIVLCKVENYDDYMETLQLAQQQRESDLDDILALVTEAEEDAPAAGAAGSRCEKALSNGTFRPQRGETTCNEGLCCGAARIPQGEVMMTIETCQAEGTTSYSYVPPRAPMATEPPAAETVDFVCIEGAKKLAAAASALATAVYMLA